MQIITKTDVEEHQTDTSCWVVRRGRVYDVTNFLSKHPGGRQAILDFAGNDVTLLMTSSDPHIHSRNAYSTLANMQIGVLEGHERNADIDRDDKEPLDFSKPMLAQVGSLGSKYSKWVHTPVDNVVRLFTNDLMELVSKSPWWLVPLLWGPVIFYNLFQGYHVILNNPQINMFGFDVTCSAWMLPFIFLAGCATWPFLEYFLHRFVFHLEPSGSSQSLIRFHFTIHGLHHKAPYDPYHLVFPPLPAAIVAVVIWSIYSVLLPVPIINGWFAGTVLGYITYDLTHYYLHHGHPAPDSYFGRLKKWHIRHHYIDPDHGFGVSSNFLDFPFGTDFPNFKYK